MKRWPLTFALLLPMAELCVWFLMLTVPALEIFVNLEVLARGSDVAHVQFGQFSQNVSRNEFVSFATTRSSYQNSHFLTALNMPGMFGEILIDLPTTWPDSWSPAGTLLDSWRSLVLPLYCLPTWLLVGCGVDELLGWRRLHWSVLLVGTILSILFMVLFTGLSITHFTSPEREDSSWILFGFAFWTILFGTLPAAWIKQWRTGRAGRHGQDQAVTTGAEVGSPPTSVSASS